MQSRTSALQRRCVVRRCVVAGLAFTFGAGPVLSATPYEAVTASDMGEMITAIEAYYEDAGLSFSPIIDWKIEPFTTTYWFYDPQAWEITVGAVPEPAEVDAYWQTWSIALTDGNFDHTEFFADADEAREMASYNQFVLATHESAHAMTFRYDYGHLQRHDYDINCREYYADRLTVGILNDLAETHPDMARWRARYQALVTAMGETIPAKYRVTIPDFAALDADCAVIEVSQPTPESMQAYASAYFERYRVLLDAELPPVAELFETHLVARNDADFGEYPPAEGYADLELRTLRQTEDLRIGWSVNGVMPEQVNVSRAAGFAPDGSLHLADLAYDWRANTFGLDFHPEGEDPDFGELGIWPLDTRGLEMESVAVFSENEFYFCFTQWQYEDEAAETGQRAFVTIGRMTRASGSEEWTLDPVIQDEGYGQCLLSRSESGKLWIMLTDESLSGHLSYWQLIEADRETLEPISMRELSYELRGPLAVDDEGAVFYEYANRIWRIVDGEGDSRVAGNGLLGPRDGPFGIGETVIVEAFQPTEDGALFVENRVKMDGNFIRELGPAATE